MISDWYFCTCIGVNPEQTRTFLSIMDVFQSPDSDAMLLDMACNELERCDSWMQIYALPKLFDVLLREDLSTSKFRENINRIYRNVLRDFLSEGQPEFFDELISAILNNKQNLWIALRACLQKLSGPSLRTQTSLPYLDLREYVPEILTLVVVRHLIRTNTNSIPAIKEEIDASGSELAILIQDALEYHYDRLTLRLAAWISGLVDTGDSYSRVKQRLVNILAAVPDANIGFEPDLLQTSAEILFAPAHHMTKDERDFLVKSIIEETLAFEFIPEPPESISIDSKPTQIYGSLRDDDKRTVRLIYWQVILWQLAQEIDPVITASALTNQWLLMEAPIEHRIRINQPSAVAENHHAYWLDQLFYLAQVHPRSNGRLDIQIQRPVTDQNPNDWIFVSPALPLNKDALYLAHGLTGAARYPSVGRQVTLLRLLAASMVAIRLLQRLKSTNNIARMALAAFLVHCSDVLTLTFLSPRRDDRSAPRNNWLNGYKGPGAEKIPHRLSMQMTGLALFVETQVRSAGKGEFASIEPELFAALLSLPCPSPMCNFQPDFQRLVLPQVLVHWILEGFSGACPGSGPARWLELLPTIVESYPYDQYRDLGYDKFGRMEAALLTRFLLPERWDPDLYADLNWQTAKHSYQGKEQESYWSVDSRFLLLTPQLPPELWKPDWKEPERGLLLERAIERLASLKYGNTVLEADREIWLGDFSRAISLVITHENLNRFTRVRLLEFMSDPVLERQQELQEIIALTLLEHGSSYDQFLLLRQVFGWHRDLQIAESSSTSGGSLKDVDSQAESYFDMGFSDQLRISLLQSIYRIVQSFESGQKRRITAQSPYFQRQLLENQNLFREFLYWIAGSPRQAEETSLTYSSSSLDGSFYDDVSQLTEELFTLRQDDLDDRIDRGQRVSILDVEIKEAGKTVRTTGLPTFPLAYQGMSFDPNSMSAKLFFKDLEFDASGVTNLFDFPGVEAVHDFISNVTNVPVQVLAIVTDRVDNRYTFDFGAWFTRNYISSDLDCVVGDIVRLSLYRKGDGGVDIYERNEIRKLRPKWHVGSITYLDFYKKQDGANMNVRLIERDRDVWNKQRSDLWLPDLSQYFSPTVFSEEVVAVREDDAGMWKPFDRSLMDLLLRFSFPDTKQQITLVYVDSSIDLFGGVNWRFSSAPGQNYQLSPRHFLPDHAAEIIERLATYSDPCGLIITVEKQSTSDRVFLRLAEEIAEELPDNYVNLSIPFDDRNIRWKQIFDDAADVDWEAHFALEDKRWWLHLADHDKLIDGFPRRLPIRWDDKNPDRAASEVILSNIRLDTKKGEVHASWEKTLEVRSWNNDWKSFWNNWYPLQKDDVVHIVEAFGNISADGQVYAKTRDGLIISVDAESLDLRPLKERISIREERVVLLSSVSDKRPRLVEIDWEDSRPAFGMEQECTGILIGVPDKHTNTARCLVLWKIGDQLQQTRVTISSKEDIKWFVGMTLSGIKSSHGWQFTAYYRQVIGRALWKEEEFDENQPLVFLGIVRHDDQWKPLAQNRRGSFVVMPYTSNTTPHVSQGVYPHFLGGVDLGMKAENTARAPSFRTRLEVDNVHSKEILCGFPNKYSERGSDQNGSVQLRSIGIRLSSVQYKDNIYFDISRKLGLLPIGGDEQVEKDNEDKFQHFSEYMENEIRRDIRCRYVNGKVIFDEPFFVPVDADAPLDILTTEWIDRIDVAPGEGPFIDALAYQPFGFIQLVKNDGKYQASFKRVKPLNVDQLYYEMGGIGPGIKFVPPEKLYYVGEETFDPIDNSRLYDEPNYRFEWGYGKTVRIPKSRLLYKESPFDNSEFVMFYGDWPSRISFIEAASAPDESKYENQEIDDQQPLKYCLNIANIAFTAEHKLYLQRKQNIIHRLHLLIENEEIVVSQVDGIDDESQEEMRGFSLRAQAQLTESSLRRLHEQITESPKERVILARLQQKEFERNRGRSVMFNYVRLTVPPSSGTKVRQNRFEVVGGPELLDAQDVVQWNEIIFLQIKCIDNSFRNDIGLRLVIPEKLLDSDVDPQLKDNLVVLHRQFSARQELLWRLDRDEDAGNRRVSGREVLVRLESSENSSHPFSLTMLHGISRTERVLERAIESNKGTLYATLLDIDGKRSEGVLVLEIKPGIFIRIPFARLEQFSGTLSPRDTVRVENRPGGFFAVTRMNPAQDRYLPSGIRPAIALPKNTLLRIPQSSKIDVHDPATWLQNKDFRFTIGGLPDLVVIPGEYIEGYWENPVPDRFIELMEKTYSQKLVSIGLDSSHNNRKIPRVSPGISPTWFAGKITVDRNDFSNPCFTSMDETSEDLSFNIAWHQASFADEPIDSIRERIITATWRYHDNRTARWVVIEGKPETASQEYISNQKLKNGPVFVKANHPVLRYSLDDFQRIGYPVGELLQQLRESSNNRAYYTVAGVSDLGGLWVEILPGRLIEVPGQMLTWLLPTGLHPISNLAWGLFAAGDQVEFELGSTDLLAHDLLILRDWKPSIRRMFNNGRCFLPIGNYDESKGGLKLGQGRFELVMPWKPTDPAWKVIVLDQRNNINNAAIATPARGDVIFLGLDEAEGRTDIVCLSFPDWQASFFRTQIDDVLFDLQDAMSSPDRQLKMIRAAGGSLPVTVERIDAERRIIYFSMRNQLPRKKDVLGKLVPAKILGVPFPDEGIVLLCSGTSLWCATFEEIISGLPSSKSILDSITNKLKRLTEFIWIRVSETDGKLTFGMLVDDGPNQEIRVKAIYGIQGDSSDGDNKNSEGLICQSTVSRMLYWLPESHVGWFSQKPEDWEKMINRSPELSNLYVRMVNRPGKSPFISVIQTERARREFDLAIIGKELVVKTILELTQPVKEEMRLFLVQSIGSGVTLCLETARKNHLPSEFTAEITRRSSRIAHQIVVAPLNERPPAFDLPAWMLLTDGTHLVEEYFEQIEKTVYFISQEAKIDRAGLLQMTLNLPDNLQINHLLDIYYYTGILDKNSVEAVLMAKKLLEWKNAHLKAKELNLIDGLAVVLGLYEFGKVTESEELLENISSRCLRSLHCETLLDDWLAEARWRLRRDNLSRRLEEIHTRINGNYAKGKADAVEQQIEKFNLVRNFCRTVNVRRVSDFHSTAVGLSASIGELDTSDIESLRETAGNTSRITTMIHTTARKEAGVLAANKARLHRWLISMIKTRQYILLLDPFTFDWSESTQSIGSNL